MNDHPNGQKVSRRAFMKTVGVTAAAIGSSAHVAFGQANEKKIRMAVVGGGFGRSFYWHEHPNSVVTAVCDIQSKKLDMLKQTYRCDTGYDDFHKLLTDKNVDAIAVFTPAPLHVYHSVKALEAGKHVISAVPASMTLEGCQQLIDAVRRTGLTYMMAETSVYRQETISVRQWYKEGKFGEIFFTELEYHHEKLLKYYYDDRGLPTWRYGMPPMLYPTHCTSYLTSVTGERFTEVSAIGWGDGHEVLQSNLYHNPFWNTTGFFKTSGGHSSRVSIFWHVAAPLVERATWYGNKMSFFMPRQEGGVSMLGWGRDGQAASEQVEIPKHYMTMLPEPLRRESGHGGSHTFITHEFVTALVEKRKPLVDVYEAVAYTAPGIVAHESALRDGERLIVPNFDPTV